MRTPPGSAVSDAQGSAAPPSIVEVDIEDLVGKTVRDYLRDDDMLTLWTDEYIYQLRHEQDCCEVVYLDDVVGDLDDLLDEPVLVAVEETSRDETPSDPVFRPYLVAVELLGGAAPGASPDESPGSETWTFYKIDTRKGGVTLRWYGASNGYYSERVDIMRRRRTEDDRR